MPRPLTHKHTGMRRVLPKFPFTRKTRSRTIDIFAPAHLANLAACCGGVNRRRTLLEEQLCVCTLHVGDHISAAAGCKKREESADQDHMLQHLPSSSFTVAQNVEMAPLSRLRRRLRVCCHCDLPNAMREAGLWDWKSEVGTWIRWMEGGSWNGWRWVTPRRLRMMEEREEAEDWEKNKRTIIVVVGERSLKGGGGRKSGEKTSSSSSRPQFDHAMGAN